MRTIIAAGVLFLFGCSIKNETNPESLKKQLIKVDKAMSDMAAIDGFNNSILFYADSNLVKLEEGRLPVIGKTTFADSYDKNRDIKTISWTPVNAEVARSGELGYTWGNWKFTAGDTVLFGNYFTIWKKQPGGNWKVALDGGNNTPQPNT